MTIIVIRNDNHFQVRPSGRRLGDVIVVNRFRVAEQDGEDFRVRVLAAHEALAARPGYLDGTIGRNVDDPQLWVLTTRWANVGSYRRALSAYDVKVTAVPLLSQAIDEPSAYELVGEDALNQAVPRALGGREAD
jgi:quinol monooxygenase YgiN